ncbi:hypothetical protein ABL78_0382 [Leptomonas seymouri]|uniref:Uncharacterized protein n=1 Tax=Leptomonas seymouri TaxID=5684 RepID=A0A0N1I215_LEPSE|nr:hypothetical protein ABL78_0382 [Leptomonas seymouri]|eukprot:KPI90452.1 hypothetical protein ABL78_0382 [Leptomonas seymouri]
MSEAPVAARALRAKKGAVFLGDNFIELEDPSTVTLEDLCESFGTPWESGMHVRQRSTGRIVATLPFEPLPPFTEVADITIKSEATGIAVAAAVDASIVGAENDSINTKDEDMDESDDEENQYAVVYDLVNSNALEMDETAGSLAGTLAANIRGIPGIKETMRQLVELGAAELLTAEPLSVVSGKREYNAAEAPGLLRRIVYPASQYSPYRAERDPLSDGKHALFRNTAGPSSLSPTSAAVPPYKVLAFVGEGGPYTSYLDSYALVERVELPGVPVTGVKSASLVAPLSNEEQEKIFGA